MLQPLVLALALAPSVAVRPGPVRPPEFQGPRAVAKPLDRLLAESGDPRGVLENATPEDWCPSGADFRRWLAARQALAGTKRAAPPSPSVRGGTAHVPGQLGDPGRPASHVGPRIQLIDGVVVMEDDGTLTRNDRQPDLEGMGLELTPGPGGMSVTRIPLALDPNLGTQVITDQRGFAEVPVDFTLTTFPFAGQSQTRAWVTTTMGIFFARPPALGPAQLLLGDSIADRTPRVAPLQTGTSIYAWNAFVREMPDRVLFTWRTNEPWLSLDVQAVLFDDGRIQFHYGELWGVDHGSVVVVDGDPAWWADRAPAGTVLDPGAEVAIAAPDGPAIDVLEVRAFQVGGSELMDVEVVLEQPLPAATDGTLQFAFDLRDEPGDVPFNTLWAEWEDGRFNWTSTAWVIDGNVLRASVPASSMPLTDEDFEVVVWTAQNWAWQDVVGGVFTYPIVPKAPLLRDFSAAPWTGRGPLVEAFTIPELLPGTVYEEFMEHFGAPRVDGLAIYQNFYTDIIFYAGAYSTVGNAGADGIGTGNTTDPESPALLHMNTLLYGWNSWDEGKVMVLNHEFGHHWLYFLSIMEGGATPTRILGEGHPAGWVHTPAATPVYNAYDASCMGGSTWTDNGNGTFTSAQAFASYGFSWHDLYLMGLADPSEIDDWFYLRDSVPDLPGAYWPQANLTVDATRVDVALRQVVDAIGPRVPGTATSRTEFVVPMVLLVRPGEWTQADVDEVERTCDVWAPKFEQATIARATVTCDRVGFRPPDCRIATPASGSRFRPGEQVPFMGSGEDPDGDAVTLTWDFGPGQAPATGPGPHWRSFPGNAGHLVVLRAVDETGAEDPEPAATTVIVVCETPPSVSDLRVAHRDGVLTFTWSPLFPAPNQYVMFSSTSASAGFGEQAAGRTGLRLPEPPGLAFYLIAARNSPDCLGPLTP